MSASPNFNSIMYLTLIATTFFAFLQHTIHGLCLTDYRVNARMDVGTFVTISRDLSQCEHFSSRALTSSPLALLHRLVRQTLLYSHLKSLHFHFIALVSGGILVFAGFFLITL